MKTTFISIIIMAFFGTYVNSQNTPGNLTFSVTTLPNGGNRAPKNVLAIWIKNSSGTFVKTIKLNAIQRIQYLQQWKVSSGLNTVNATTGATLMAHQTHNVSWNCTNVSGAVVPDGDYSVWVEFADDDNIAGPFTSYNFTKGTNPVSINFPNQSNFINVSLNYTPSSSSIYDNYILNEVSTYYNSITNEYEFTIPAKTFQKAIIKIYDLKGNEIYQNQEFNFEDGLVKTKWKTTIQKNIFIYKIELNNNFYTGKLLTIN